MHQPIDETIVVDSPLDMHLHLRQGVTLKYMTQFSAEHFSGGLIMPNLDPPIDTKDKVIEYRDKIFDATKLWKKEFVPYMTLFFKEKYNYRFLEEIRDYILAIKLYPKGITTKSKDGIESIKDKIEDKNSSFNYVLSCMEDLEIPLCVHGETNGFVMDREDEFLTFYDDMAFRFSNLKIIMEHITTEGATKLLGWHENLFATITPHHMMLNLDDVIGDTIKPHLFCKPIAKREHDRMALIETAIQNEKVMLGTDSAPHAITKKECASGCAGIFTAPFALPLVVDIFYQNIKNINRTQHAIQNFVSDNARKIYGIAPIKKLITLVSKEFMPKNIYFNTVSMPLKQPIHWSVLEKK